MEIPRFWAKEGAQAPTPQGRTIFFSCWRWSNESFEEARAEARRVAARVRDRIARGEPLPERYAYGTRPLREERLRDVSGPDDELAAVLTRNTYGSVILNARGALFVDSDRKPGAFSGLRRFFGGAPNDSTLEKAESVVAENPKLGLRVYATKAGARYLATNRLYDPKAAETTRLMERLDVDRSYLHLCRVQGSFRARLTPKPWRCGVGKPPTRFPFASSREERQMRDWTRSYDQPCEQRASCRFLGSVGNPKLDPELAKLVELHDDMTRSGSGLPLA